MSSSSTRLLDAEDGVVHDDGIAKAESGKVAVFSTAEIRDKEFYRSVLAEFLGTSFFVAFSIGGTESAIKTFENEAARHVFVLLYHVILILICIYAFGHLSGAHLNPAVTWGVVATRRITLLRAVFYTGSQLLGSISGTLVMRTAIPAVYVGDRRAGLLAPPAGVKQAEAFVMELYCTAGLVFGAYATAFDPRGWGKFGPVAISLIVFLNAHTGGLVGAAMNPARAWGPAVVHGVTDALWIYFVGGLIGGVLGAVIYEYCFMLREDAQAKVPSTTGVHSAKKKD